LRDALRARVDCPLATLTSRREKEWVTVGGIITHVKRLRTRNGEPMMFATLADLEASAEILLFGKAFSEHERALAVDELVIVRGRVDHKEAGNTCVVAGEVVPFQPGADELVHAGEEPTTAQLAAREAAAPAGRTPATSNGAAHGGDVLQAPAAPLHLHLDAAHLPASVIDELKEVIEHSPGAAEVVLEILTGSGARRLRLGDSYRVDHTPALRAELERVLARRALTPRA
jgi:DNA polymerase-3 subunit alpha